MEWLKELLGKYVEADKIDTAVGEITKEMPKYTMPKAKFNEINDELKIVKGQLAEKDDAMKTLTEKASSVDEYAKKIAELQTKNAEIEETAKKQVAQITKRTQLKDLLSGAGVHKDAVDLLVDKYAETVELDDKGIKSPDKIIESIKAEKGGLFLETKANSADDDKGKQKTPDIEDAKIRKAFGL